MTAADYSGESHLEIWRWKLVQPNGFVYVIRPDGDTPIKVGFARDVKVRIAELQTGNPRPLRLLYVLPGDGRLEWNLHQRLVKSRTVGEWFDGPQIEGFLAFVADLADRIVAAADGGEAPDWRRHIEDQWVPKRPTSPVKVSFVEPDPRVPPEEAKQMREKAKGMSREMYLGRIHGAARRRISPSSGYGN